MSILSEAPDGAEVIDLAASRAARAEVDATLPPVLLKIEAGYIQVKRDLDVLCAEDFTAGRFRTGLAKLLQDPADVDELVKRGLSKDDLSAIVAHVTGSSLGE
ncbi:hypothetical protein HII28_02190 [Planctomonas sp. JC2975]|uniref:hypothetical protein n=1 Tax=Planctomonas sp. JC2975 TaxID=2729626 RepID=UPI001474ADEC|nr:hypothetical protein [Planctomonas sp. JC2975]NNC10697.1 hypothetical protein [Planctomonas sp. JC2975]